MYASFLGICPRIAWTPHPAGGSPVSEALHTDIFHQPLTSRFFDNFLVRRESMAEYIQIFTTTESRDVAEMISREVVGKRLAACVQIVGPITSTYWWEEKVQKTEEWLCMMKTRGQLYNELEKAIISLHPYEVPEIVALPIVSGSQRYLDWLEQEVKPK